LYRIIPMNAVTRLELFPICNVQVGWRLLKLPNCDLYYPHVCFCAVRTEVDFLPASCGGCRKGGASMAQTNLPILSADGGLSRYLQEIRKFPMLEPDEEYMLAKRYKEHADPGAAQKLITSHLRLVAKIAMGYRGYGLPISEVISE